MSEPSPFCSWVGLISREEWWVSSVFNLDTVAFLALVAFRLYVFSHAGTACRAFSLAIHQWWEGWPPAFLNAAWNSSLHTHICPHTHIYIYTRAIISCHAMVWCDVMWYTHTYSHIYIYIYIYMYDISPIFFTTREKIYIVCVCGWMMPHVLLCVYTHVTCLPWCPPCSRTFLQSQHVSLCDAPSLQVFFLG